MQPYGYIRITTLTWRQNLVETVHSCSKVKPTSLNRRRRRTAVSGRVVSQLKVLFQWSNEVKGKGRRALSIFQTHLVFKCIRCFLFFYRLKYLKDSNSYSFKTGCHRKSSSFWGIHGLSEHPQHCDSGWPSNPGFTKWRGSLVIIQWTASNHSFDWKDWEMYIRHKKVFNAKERQELTRQHHWWVICIDWMYLVMQEIHCLSSCAAWVHGIKVHIFQLPLAAMWNHSHLLPLWPTSVLCNVCLKNTSDENTMLKMHHGCSNNQHLFIKENFTRAYHVYWLGLSMNLVSNIPFFFDF